MAMIHRARSWLVKDGRVVSGPNEIEHPAPVGADVDLGDLAVIADGAEVYGLHAWNPVNGPSHCRLSLQSSDDGDFRRMAAGAPQVSVFLQRTGGNGEPGSFIRTARYAPSKKPGPISLGAASLFPGDRLWLVINAVEPEGYVYDCDLLFEDTDLG